MNMLVYLDINQQLDELMSEVSDLYPTTIYEDSLIDNGKMFYSVDIQTDNHVGIIPDSFSTEVLELLTLLKRAIKKIESLNYKADILFLGHKSLIRLYVYQD